jgi:hypothetical protein
MYYRFVGRGMSEDRPATNSPVFIGGLVGAAGGLCLLIYAFLATFGNPFATSVAEVLFPFALSVSPTLYDFSFATLLFALVQYPIYGVILGFAWSKNRVGKSRVIAYALALLVVHGMAVGLAKHQRNAKWGRRSSQTQQD